MRKVNVVPPVSRRHTPAQSVPNVHAPLPVSTREEVQAGAHLSLRMRTDVRLRGEVETPNELRGKQVPEAIEAVVRDLPKKYKFHIVEFVFPLTLPQY